MNANLKANKALAEMRRYDELYHLRRRPRCIDGSLNLNSRANKAFRKNSLVSDYYDPNDPTLDVEVAVIQ